MDESVRLTIALIKDLGFPVGVALFVLLRIEPRIRELSAAIYELRIVIAAKTQSP